MSEYLKGICLRTCLIGAFVGASLFAGQRADAAYHPGYAADSIVGYELTTKFSDREGYDIYHLITIAYADPPHDTEYHEAWRTTITDPDDDDFYFTDPDYDWDYVGGVLEPFYDPFPRHIYCHKLEDGWHYRYYIRGLNYGPPITYTSPSNDNAYLNIWTCTNAPRLYNAHQNNAGTGINLNWGFDSNIVDSASPFYDSNNDSYFIIYRGEVTVNGYEDINPARPENDPDDSISNVTSFTVSSIFQRQVTDSSNLSSGKKYAYAMQAYHDAASKNGLMSNLIYVDYTGTANYNAPSNLTAGSFFVLTVPWTSFSWYNNITVYFNKIFRNTDDFYQVNTVYSSFRSPSQGSSQADYSPVSYDARYYYYRVESYDLYYSLLGSTGIAETRTPLNPPTSLARNGGSDIVGVSWSHYSYRADPCGGENFDPYLCYDVSVTNNSTSEETIYYHPQDTLLVKAENPDYVWGCLWVEDVAPSTTYTVKVRAVIRDLNVRSAWSSSIQVAVD